MSEIADDFKVVLVDAIKTLCLKFPHKHQVGSIMRASVNHILAIVVKLSLFLISLHCISSLN
jgi:hypothetical protein